MTSKVAPRYTLQALSKMLHSPRLRPRHPAMERCAPPDQKKLSARPHQDQERRGIQHMLIILYAALFGLVLVVQGLFIFKTGDLRWFLLRPWTRSRPRTPATPLARIATGLFYISCGMAILSLMVYGGWRRLQSTAVRVHRHSADIGFSIYSVVFLAMGVWFLVRPVGLLRWLRTSRPDLEEANPAALRTVRVIGVGFVLIALYGIFLSFCYVG
jgi:hypothetical protein